MPKDYPLYHRKERSGVFISYARSDSEAFATKLRERLEAEKISVWLDRTFMEGGRRGWREQIKEALDQVEFMALIVTPNALKSEEIHNEARYARREGVCVYLIKGSPQIYDTNLPRWMIKKHIYDLGTIKDNLSGPEWSKFINDLNKTPDVLRVPFMANDLPEGFILCSKEFDKAKSLLYDQNSGAPIANRLALHGAGGCGKTTLAIKICHDEDIKEAFDDGILWVWLSKNPGDLTSHIEELIYQLRGIRPGSTNLQAAIIQLRNLLEDLDILIVIDGVWNEAHLRPFLQGCKGCALLITTSRLDSLPESIGKDYRVEVGVMKDRDALTLLTYGFKDLDLNPIARDLDYLAERLCYWPLLLRLVKSFLSNEVNNVNRELANAVTKAKERLDRYGLTHFDVLDPDRQQEAVAKTIGIALEELEDREQRRYFELAIFPENAEIPLYALERLWARTGGLDEDNTDILCTRLNNLSLLNYDSAKGSIRLHNFYRQYLIEQRNDQLPSIHSQLLDAYYPISEPRSYLAKILSYLKRAYARLWEPPSSNWYLLPDNQPYLWDYLAFHLIKARRCEELITTVKDWRYLVKKMMMHKVLSVENDLREAETADPNDVSLRELRKGFVSSSHLFSRCVISDDLNGLKATLFVRLQHLNKLNRSPQGLANNVISPYIGLNSNLPDLPHPALIRTLDGHQDTVNGCNFSISKDNLIVSASDDNTVKVWDARTGEILYQSDPQKYSANSCAFSPDGKRIVSAFSDGNLEVRDVNSHEVQHTLNDHKESVNGCAFSPDGKYIVSASSDSTVKIWDARTGELLQTLYDHSGSVNSCAFSHDSKLIVSASSDKTLKVWDAQTGELLRTLCSHTDSVNSCSFSRNNEKIVSASSDSTLKVWDAQSGALLHTLEGHIGFVKGCAFNGGRLIASASSDRTVKIWDADSGQMRRTLHSHSASVNSCAFSYDGEMIVSASSDKTLKVWDAHSDEKPLTTDGHLDAVWGCTFGLNGKQVVSASEDRTLKVWDADIGNVLRHIEGHSEPVLGCAFSRDGKLIVSASGDHTLKVWDAKSGKMLRPLKTYKDLDADPSTSVEIEGHSASVNHCAFNHDDKLVVSASDDNTLKIWDVASGKILRTLEGHSDFVRGCAFSYDGRLIVSASDDKTLKVWDWDSGRSSLTLKGHSDSVRDCAFSPDDSLIVSASYDKTLKVWDAGSGEIRDTLEGHAGPVSGCTFKHDGSLIVSASEDHTLKVWNARSGQYLVTFYADGPMYCCAMHSEMIVGGGLRGVYFLRLVQ